MLQKWEQGAEKVKDKLVNEDPEDQSSQPEVNQGNPVQGTNETPQNPVNPVNHAPNRIACKNCGLFNHSTKDCRRVLCEICGYTNHSTYECKRCVLWNTRPELCAA
jgi:hypothetical protein